MRMESAWQQLLFCFVFLDVAVSHRWDAIKVFIIYLFFNSRDEVKNYYRHGQGAKKFVAKVNKLKKKIKKNDHINFFVLKNWEKSMAYIGPLSCVSYCERH